MKIAQILKETRTKFGYTQEQIAQLMGINYRVYGRYEKGHNEIPIHNLIKLADIYGVSLDYLCGRDEARNQQDGSDVG